MLNKNSPELFIRYIYNDTAWLSLVVNNMEPYLFNMLVSEMVIQYSYIMISYIVNLLQFVILGICIMIGRKHPSGFAKPPLWLKQIAIMESWEISHSVHSKNYHSVTSTFPTMVLLHYGPMMVLALIEP